MTATQETPVRFIGDAMLGGLARWLRAAGYECAWEARIDDWDLVRRARREGRTLLTCDTGIFRIGIVRDGDVAGLLLPIGLKAREQLSFVMEQLDLPLLQPRCMSCGGELHSISREDARTLVPPRSYAWLDEFWRCGNCQKVFWPGTHWQSIRSGLCPLRN